MPKLHGRLLEEKPGLSTFSRCQGLEKLPLQCTQGWHSVIFLIISASVYVYVGGGNISKLPKFMEF